MEEWRLEEGGDVWRGLCFCGGIEERRALGEGKGRLGSGIRWRVRELGWQEKEYQHVALAQAVAGENR